MENREIQELRPVYIRETPSLDQREEISLVDLSLVLVKRRYLVLGVILLVTLSALISVLATAKKYTFTSTVSIGSQLVGGRILSIESPDSVLVKVQHVYIPFVLKQYGDAHPNDKNHYTITATLPKSSNILLIQGQGKEATESQYRELLNAVSKTVINDHQQISNALKQNLNAQLETAQNTLPQLGNSPEERIEAHNIKIAIDTLSNQLANLRPTAEILSAIKSKVPSTSRKLVVIIGAFAGLFLGVFAAFFVEFAEKVREKQRELE